jgi:hypothetical protein
MRTIFRFHHAFVLLVMGFVLVGASGCDGDQSTAKIEPKYSPPKQTVEDLKKDIKPPVVVKPGTPATTDTTPVTPKRESR